MQTLRQQLDALSLADGNGDADGDAEADAEGGTPRPRPRSLREVMGPHEVLAIDGVDVHWPTATVGPPLAPQQQLMEKLLRAVRPAPPPPHATLATRRFPLATRRFPLATRHAPRNPCHPPTPPSTNVPFSTAPSRRVST